MSGPAVPRLAVIVPYRDRPQHLAAFVPHLCAYFSRDVLARRIPLRVLVVEQEEGQPFNSGMTKNAGFRLVGDEVDYVCFHDVDYLPIWADYAPSEGLAGIVWYGAESRPIVPGKEARAVHNLENFFGGAVVTGTRDFAAVNGYPNAYWGWAQDDTDLRRRYLAAGLPLVRRRGTFNPLDHVHGAYRLDGTKNEVAARNDRIFAERWEGQDMKAVDRRRARIDEDGLRSTRFELLRRADLPRPDTDERGIRLEMAVVRLTREP